jgi:hypothetical protein
MRIEGRPNERGPSIRRDAGPHLLDDVRQFVGEDPSSWERFGRELSLRERDVSAPSERSGTER